MEEDVIKRYKESILAKFIINGKPVGEITPREAFAWLDNQNQKTDFLSSLLSGVSLFDVRLIKDIVTPDEADKAWDASGGRSL